MQQINLHNGWYWACPECGTDNLEKGQEYQPTPEEQEQIDAHFGGVRGQVVVTPQTVLCSSCLGLFKAPSNGLSNNDSSS